MNTFTFTDDEAAIISVALRRYSYDVERYLNEADELNVDDFLTSSIRECSPAIESAREKIDRPKEK